MNTYLGMSREDLESSFIYNKEDGIVLSRKTGLEVGSDYPSGLVVKKRHKGKVVSLSLGKMCYFMLHDVKLTDSDMILYKDGDKYNLRPDNLELSNCPTPRLADERECVVEVDRRIFYNPNTSEFVVRRGKKQAIYRCFTLKEAILIRNEWESDKTIHRWDIFSRKYV